MRKYFSRKCTDPDHSHLCMVHGWIDGTALYTRHENAYTDGQQDTFRAHRNLLARYKSYSYPNMYNATIAANGEVIKTFWTALVRTPEITAKYKLSVDHNGAIEELDNV